VDEATAALLPQLVLVISFPDKMALLIGMNSALIVKNWVIDDVPGLQFWRNLPEVAGALRGGGLILFFVFVLISIAKILI
jgi:hypothetical protein